MNTILNNAIMPFVNQGKLSMKKINDLISLKEFIDRNSSFQYLVGDTVEGMKAKYGAAPDVVTWGDYFQTELASDAVHYSDEEFSKVAETVKFDLISAHHIFSENSQEFYKWVENFSHEIILSGKDKYTEEEQEILHLKILKDYYINLGVYDNFTVEEIAWYNSFSENADASGL
jgi:hypothetical protein